MSTHSPYTDPGLSLDSLAGMTGINRNRNRLSRVINRSFGVNFNQFVNDHRIKYAVRLLSEPASENISTEQLMERAGFSNRNSFYTTFKQATGLTPAQYRKARTDLRHAPFAGTDDHEGRVSK